MYKKAIIGHYRFLLISIIATALIDSLVSILFIIDDLNFTNWWNAFRKEFPVLLLLLWSIRDLYIRLDKEGCFDKKGKGV